MAITRLSTIVVPGRNYTFTAKDPVVPGGKGVGVFTRLSTVAVPGRNYSFVAKDPAVPDVPVSDPVTRLSTIAVPGRRYNFVAKTAVPFGSSHVFLRVDRDELEERDIQDIITIIRMTGILE